MITELMQKMTDPSPKSCPECGSKRIAKLVSRSAFQLKGGGWYADLYASRKKDGKDANAPEGAAAAPAPAPAAAAAKAGEAKPVEAKAEAKTEAKVEAAKAEPRAEPPAAKPKRKR
jgi:putative FmdB family regulatory protein